MPSESVLQTAPAWTMGKKNNTLLLDDAGPGPGAYNPTLSSSQCLSSRAVGFGTSVRSASYGEGVYFTIRQLPGFTTTSP
jgi:hypothetical protein